MPGVGELWLERYAAAPDISTMNKVSKNKEHFAQTISTRSSCKVSGAIGGNNSYSVSLIGHSNGLQSDVTLKCP
jgi:hypothetical protein